VTDRRIRIAGYGKIAVVTVSVLNTQIEYAVSQSAVLNGASLNQGAYT